uniref:Uncharacterized protein n=1 Tax=Malurus cyaneus samueli TaxID=2593467 RepID=A0A8C5TS94_9PASS
MTLTKKKRKPSSGEERPQPYSTSFPSLVPFQAFGRHPHKSLVRRSYTLCGTAHLLSPSARIEAPPGRAAPLRPDAALPDHAPLSLLKGLEVSVLQAGRRQTPKKPSEVADAFTRAEREDLASWRNGFLYQKYLSSPAETGTRSPSSWRLTNAQASPGSKNRRASSREPGGDEGRRGSAKKLGPPACWTSSGLCRAGATAPREGQGTGTKRTSRPPHPAPGSAAGRLLPLVEQISIEPHHNTHIPKFRVESISSACQSSNGWHYEDGFV